MGEPASVTLLSPANGSTNVDPHAEILVAFRGIDDDLWEKSVYIKVDGETAVHGGLEVPPFRTTRIQKAGEFAYVGLRRVGGLRPRDVVVQAFAGPNLCSVDQRFFVRGASVTVSHGVSGRILVEKWQLSGPTVVCQGGVVVGGDRFPVPSSWAKPHLITGKKTVVVYEDPGVILVLTKRGVKTHWIPPKWVASVKKVVGLSFPSGNWWVGILDQNGELTVITNRGSHRWSVAASDVYVSNSFVHLDLGHKTAHLPLNYEPSAHEKHIDSWYLADKPHGGSMAFLDDYCVWWSQDRMISKHGFSPFLGESDDMLWTKDDIGEEFAEVGIVDSHHVLVNGHLYLNTLYPEVVRL